ncbi:MAG: sensor histidine kinase N-terminal domain-containing protein, partial [Phycisphaerae bacterium]
MRSLRARLVIGTTVGMAAVLLAAGVVVYLLARASLVDQLDSSLIDKARLLASAVEHEGPRVEPEFDELDLSAYRSPDGPGYLQLRHENGPVVFRSPSLEGRDLDPVPTADATPSCRWLKLGDGRTGRAVTLAFRPRRDEDK